MILSSLAHRPTPIVLADGGGTNVRSWHKADVQTALMNVRFEGNNGHDADVTHTVMSAN